jgi:hypothetical protein
MIMYEDASRRTPPFASSARNAAATSCRSHPQSPALEGSSCTCVRSLADLGAYLGSRLAAERLSGAEIETSRASEAFQIEWLAGGYGCAADLLPLPRSTGTAAHALDTRSRAVPPCETIQDSSLDLDRRSVLEDVGLHSAETRATSV